MSSNAAGFNGERIDPLSGLTHTGNGYRAYNPSLMRFNSPDDWSPFGNGGVNPYTWCENDPINREDPSGHMSMAGISAIITGVLAVAGIFTAGYSLAVLAGFEPVLAAASIATETTGIAVGSVAGTEAAEAGITTTAASMEEMEMATLSSRSVAAIEEGVTDTRSLSGASLQAGRMMSHEAEAASSRVADATNVARTTMSSAERLSRGMRIFSGITGEFSNISLVTSHGIKWFGHGARAEKLAADFGLAALTLGWASGATSFVTDVGNMAQDALSAERSLLAYLRTYNVKSAGFAGAKALSYATEFTALGVLAGAVADPKNRTLSAVSPWLLATAQAGGLATKWWALRGPFQNGNDFLSGTYKGKYKSWTLPRWPEKKDNTLL